MITLIAAIGKNREIGLNGKLLWHIPDDLTHFKNYTLGKMIVMGSNTFASIGNKPLPGRKCVVISTHGLAGLAIHAKSVDAALSIEHCYPEIVVIGGASVYEQTISRASKLVITHVDAKFNADTYFPEIDLSVWKINTSIDKDDGTYAYKIVEYVRYESIRDN